MDMIAWQTMNTNMMSCGRMTPLTPVMPRSIKIVEGGYCPDIKKNCKKKQAQHKALEGALKNYGYNVTTLPITTA